MSLNCAGTVQPTLGFKVGLMGFFGCGKKTYVVGFPVNLNIRLPLFALPSSNTKIARSVSSTSGLRHFNAGAV